VFRVQTMYGLAVTRIGIGVDVIQLLKEH